MSEFEGLAGISDLCRGPGISDLLSEKVKEAERSMTERLNRTLWGSEWQTTTNSSSDTVNIDTINTAMEKYKSAIADNIFKTSPLFVSPTMYQRLSTIDSTPWKKEAMSDTHDAIREARAERKEERARELLEEIENELYCYELAAGTIVAASAEFPNNTTVYEYAWVRGSNDRWYRTASRESFSDEDVIDELARLAIDARDFSWRVVGPGE